MEKRNVEVSLAKAREWYKSGNKALKEVALQAFTKEELEATDFKNITCFGDAIQALGLDFDTVMEHIDTLKGMGSGSKQLVAIFMLNIVRKALNGGETPKLTSSSIFYPWVRFLPKEDAAAYARCNGYVTKEEFINEGSRYQLVGGACDYWTCGGVGHFGGGEGYVYAHAGLFCCKSAEIAKHMSKHFAKLIFEAVYAQYNFVEWED